MSLFRSWVTLTVGALPVRVCLILPGSPQTPTLVDFDLGHGGQGDHDRLRFEACSIIACVSASYERISRFNFSRTTLRRLSASSGVILPPFRLDAMLCHSS